MLAEGRGGVDISHPYFNLVEPACSHMLVSVCICCCVHLIILTYTCWLKIELSENMHASIHINIVTLSKHSQHGPRELNQNGFSGARYTQTHTHTLTTHTNAQTHTTTAQGHAALCGPCATGHRRNHGSESACASRGTARRGADCGYPRVSVQRGKF